MKVLISGSSGLVGSALVRLLEGSGHEVVRLVRRTPDPGGGTAANWDPAAGTIDAAALEGLDGVVHLAGENIAGGRWNQALKERIRSSRVDGTRLLAETLAGLDRPPQCLLSASAIGFYADRGDEQLDESSPVGAGFLADVCRAWESAAEPAREAGIRVVNLRIGVVLASDGGALKKMLLPFKLGLGGRVGSGRQWWSWIAIDDVVGAIQHALLTESLTGPLNLVAPNPATNLEFTKALGRVLRRPTVFPMPAFAARLALGEMADELLLASTRVDARRLTDSGYEFRCPGLDGALRHVLES